MDDRALLDRLRSGDQAAFDSMFRDHYPHLVTFGQSLLRDRAAAEDIAQEVMLELWRRRADIVIQESLRAYLLRATRNRSLNQLRHANVARRAEPQLVGEESISAAGASKLVAAELRDALTTAVAELPPGCREVFVLHDVEGYEHKEIAAMLGIAEGTSKSQVFKARMKLRALLT